MCYPKREGWIGKGVGAGEERVGGGGIEITNEPAQCRPYALHDDGPELLHCDFAEVALDYPAVEKESFERTC